MTDKELEEIEARERAATKGPWVSDNGACQQGRYGEPEGASIYSGEITIVKGGAQDEQGGEVGVVTNEDADFIAHARTDVPRLTAEVRRLRAELARSVPCEVVARFGEISISAGIGLGCRKVDLSQTEDVEYCEAWAERASMNAPRRRPVASIVAACLARAAAEHAP